jgi:hypothetical protein
MEDYVHILLSLRPMQSSSAHMQEVERAAPNGSTKVAGLYIENSKKK